MIKTKVMDVKILVLKICQKLKIFALFDLKRESLTFQRFDFYKLCNKGRPDFYLICLVFLQINVNFLNLVFMSNKMYYYYFSTEHKYSVTPILRPPNLRFPRILSFFHQVPIFSYINNVNITRIVSFL